MSEMQPVTMRFALTHDDVARAVRRLSLRNKANRLCILAGAVWTAVGLGTGSLSLALAGIAFLAWMLVCIGWLVPKRAWAICEHGQMTFQLDETEIVAEAAEVSSRYRWGYWEEVLLLSDVYLLRCKRGYVLLPRAAFELPEDEARFRGYCGGLLAKAASPS